MNRALIASVLIASGLLAVGHSQPGTQAANASARWLERDVAYIITDSERSVFQSLRTSAEKGAFIEEFWNRRNPQPLSSRNSAREEHYLRLEQSTTRFASTSQPDGWKTDRGRIYIVYGPPQRVEDGKRGIDGRGTLVVLGRSGQLCDRGGLLALSDRWRLSSHVGAAGRRESPSKRRLQTVAPRPRVRCTAHLPGRLAGQSVTRS